MCLTCQVLTIFIQDEFFYLIYLIAFRQLLNFGCELDIFFYLLTQSIDKTNVFSRKKITFIFEISLELDFTFNCIFRVLFLLIYDNRNGIRNLLLNFEIVSSFNKLFTEIIYPWIFQRLNCNLILLLFLFFSFFEKLLNIRQSCFNIRINFFHFLLE